MREGVPMIVRKRGHETQGAIVLKIDRCDGTAQVLAQARMDDEIVWNPINGNATLPEAEAEKIFLRQAEIDPDLWLVEIEDKQGRPWFPGRVVKL
jgi:hypothetical protein